MACLRSLSAAGPRLAARRPLFAPLPRATTQRCRSPQPQRQHTTAPAQAAGSGHTPAPGGGGGGGGGEDAQQPLSPREARERPTGGGAAAPNTAAGPDAPTPPERAAPLPADAAPAGPSPAPAPAPEFIPPVYSDTVQRRFLSAASNLIAGMAAACFWVFPASSSSDVALVTSLGFLMLAAWMMSPELRYYSVRETLIGGLALGAGAALTAVTKSGWPAVWAAALCLACSVGADAWPRHREMILASALYALPWLVCLGAGALMAAQRATQSQQRRSVGVAWLSAAPARIWSAARGK
ncbi:hypothetical protein HYH03_002091 [Edaphochlamys debaryana]|uniref:Uncharacterized protein n=1 Tax=Edaphochlamys debaryana TaxID=47281 RepID=A0A836C4F8_9CHLO|nr:hypothetical protein HYH03_002091 [Edaphochlamys debaryana]|eukprot:KAG2499795.1 hypothetical protein HYH03_002091 [Edaphochlamys debaryana]